MRWILQSLKKQWAGLSLGTFAIVISLIAYFTHWRPTLARVRTTSTYVEIKMPPFATLNTLMNATPFLNLDKRGPFYDRILETYQGVGGDILELQKHIPSRAQFIKDGSLQLSSKVEPTSPVLHQFVFAYDQVFRTTTSKSLAEMLPPTSLLLTQIVNEGKEDAEGLELHFSVQEGSINSVVASANAASVHPSHTLSRAIVKVERLAPGSEVRVAIWLYGTTLTDVRNGDLYLVWRNNTRRIQPSAIPAPASENE